MIVRLLPRRLAGTLALTFALGVAATSALTGRVAVAAQRRGAVISAGDVEALTTGYAEGANPAGATVITPVAFADEPGTVKVRHVVVVRAGRVVNDTWQVDPAPSL